MTPFQVPLARQEFWEMANGPVMATLLTDKPTEPVLVTWTLCAALVIPTATEPNERLAGETETEATGATPAPARFIFFFNDTATTEIYPLSLHDALPI